MGGKAQPQIHTHLLLNLDAGSKPAEAPAAPRRVVGELLAATDPRADGEAGAR